jgi:hypothetical protein
MIPRNSKDTGSVAGLPPDQKALYFGPRAKFGLLGSIVTKEDCEARHEPTGHLRRVYRNFMRACPSDNSRELRYFWPAFVRERT